jgi:hypothetical protein
MKTIQLYFSLVMLFSLGSGCGSIEQSEELSVEDGETLADGKADSSSEATVLDFEFDAELFTSGWVTSPESIIEDQLLYTIGQLNGQRSVGRLDKLKLSNIARQDVQGGTRLTYHAMLPVAWGSKVNLPERFEVVLPRDVSTLALEKFTAKYMHTCVEYGAHDVDSGSLWYYFRPAISGCVLEEVDVQRLTATITVSQNNTTGKYPEYDLVWEDGALKVVAIFGKYEDGAVNDVGINGYNTFVAKSMKELKPYGLTTLPAGISSKPGVADPDVTLQATLANGRRVEITALLVDNVRTAGPKFDARYEELSTSADLIIYNGHAGLGQNVRALARKGRFVSGKYLIVFMNGCDTFAYVDGSLAQARAALNPDDPTGTKFMEIVTNAMPAFFSSMSNASLALVRGLMSFEKPLTYEQIFKNIDSSQVVIVTGEEDNTFTP